MKTRRSAFQGSGGAPARAGRHAQYCAFGEQYKFHVVGIWRERIAAGEYGGGNQICREPHVYAATLKLQLVYLGSDCSVFKQKKSARFSVLERTHWWWSGEWTSGEQNRGKAIIQKEGREELDQIRRALTTK